MKIKCPQQKVLKNNALRHSIVLSEVSKTGMVSLLRENHELWNSVD